MAITHFNQDTFEMEVLGAEKPVLVDFWASWCGPCKAIAPILEDLEQEIQDKAIVGKVNVDEESELAEKYGVMSIPTLVLFKDGQEVKRSVGLQSKQALLRLVEDAAD